MHTWAMLSRWASDAPANEKPDSYHRIPGATNGGAIHICPTTYLNQDMSSKLINNDIDLGRMVQIGRRKY